MNKIKKFALTLFVMLACMYVGYVLGQEQTITNARIYGSEGNYTLEVNGNLYAYE